MKDFNRWLGGILPKFDFYRAMSRLSGAKPRTEGNQVVFGVQDVEEAVEACPPGRHVDVWMYFLQMVSRSPVTMCKCWTLSGLANDGVKVYCPTEEECGALAQIEMNVPWSAYRQPFGTFAVVLPDGFYPRRISEDIGRPIACVLRFDEAARLLSFFIADNDSTRFHLTAQYVWSPDARETIESRMGDVPPHDGMSDDELTCIGRVKRIAINACLLLTQHGARRLGSANPEHAAKLREKLKKKGIPEHIREQNRAALLAIPELYGFDQHIRIYDREDGPHDATGTGASPRPHWRRGHWRQQPFGAGGQQRRLTFIRPVLVNAHRFAGTPADTRVTMTTAP